VSKLSANAICSTIFLPPFVAVKYSVAEGTCIVLRTALSIIPALFKTSACDRDLTALPALFR